MLPPMPPPIDMEQQQQQASIQIPTNNVSPHPTLLEVLGGKTIVSKQTIRVTSSQLKLPEINRIIVKKRDLKFYGKRPHVDISTGFQ